jgi:hypothetical protein
MFETMWVVKGEKESNRHRDRVLIGQYSSHWTIFVYWTASRQCATGGGRPALSLDKDMVLSPGALAFLKTARERRNEKKKKKQQA